MLKFEIIEPKPGVVAYHFVFPADEFLVVYRQTTEHEELIYSSTLHKKPDDDKFLRLNERNWSSQIAQLTRAVNALAVFVVEKSAGDAVSASDLPPSARLR